MGYILTIAGNYYFSKILCEKLLIPPFAGTTHCKCNQYSPKLYLPSSYTRLINAIMAVTINKTRKIKKITFAISAAATAIPVKPRTPAIIATIKKVNTHISMFCSP